MKTRIGLLMMTAACLTQTAAAHETRIEKRETCVCTIGDGPPPAIGDHQVPGGDENTDIDIQVSRDEKIGENRVVIVRRSHMGGADANKDGKITRKEFMARAGKHFEEMDKNGDGSLSKEEAHPPLPPIPPMPPMPPVPPIPPVPPTPPTN